MSNQKNINILETACESIRKGQYIHARQLLTGQKQFNNVDKICNDLLVLEALDGNFQESIKYALEGLTENPGYAPLLNNALLLLDSITDENTDRDIHSLRTSKVIIIYNYPSAPMRIRDIDRLFCFEKYAACNISYINLEYMRDPPALSRKDCDVILIHSSVFEYLISAGSLDKFRHTGLINSLRNSQAVKAALPDTGTVLHNSVIDFISECKIDILLTALPELLSDETGKSINSCEISRIQQFGIDPDRIRDFEHCSIKKNLDLLCWSRTTSLSERNRTETARLADYITLRAYKKNIFTNILSGTTAELSGDEWIKFLSNYKYCLIRNQIADKQESLSPEKLVNAAQMIIPALYFESVLAGTCPIFFEDEAPSQLAPGVHYILLKKDLSNLDEVFEIISGDSEDGKVAEKAMSDLILSGNYFCRGYISSVFRQIINSAAWAEKIGEKEDGLILSDVYVPETDDSIAYSLHLAEALRKACEKNEEGVNRELFLEIGKILNTVLLQYKTKQVKNYLHSGDLVSVYQLLKSINALMPDDQQFIVFLGNIFKMLGEYEKAAELLKSIVHPDQKDPAAGNLLTNIYLELRQYDLAEKYNDSVLRIFPDDKESQKIKAKITFCKGEFAGAEKNISEYFKKFGNDYELMKIDASIKRVSGKYTESISIFEQLLQQNSSDWTVLIELAENYRKLKRTQDCLQVVAMAKDLNPSINNWLEYSKIEKISRQKEEKQHADAVLLIYHHPLIADANTILEHVDSFGQYSQYKMIKVNTELGFPEILNSTRFPVILLHYSLFGCYPFQLNDKFRMFLADSHDNLKIAFFQDEYTNCPQRFDFLNRYNINIVYSLLNPEDFKDVYYKYTKVDKVLFNLTGYINDSLLQTAESLHIPNDERPIDVGYRSRKLPYYFGIGGQEKHLIGVEFKKIAPQFGLKTDIETDENSRIYGDNWSRFLADCKAMIGVESGTSIFDLDGQAQKKYAEYMAENPEAEFEEVFRNVLKEFESNVPYRTISPRHFEAAAFRICQILYEGNYSGILKPHLHYIPLKKDFSNIQQVIETFRDKEKRQAIIDRAYQDLILSGAYTYKRFIEDLDKVLKTQCGIGEDGSQEPEDIKTELIGQDEFISPSFDLLARLETEINLIVSRISRLDSQESLKVIGYLKKRMNMIMIKIRGAEHANLMLRFLNERAVLFEYLEFSRGKNENIQITS